jgi:putative tryptophan/tyrosine transport system substrate-binding protein
VIGSRERAHFRRETLNSGRYCPGRIAIAVAAMNDKLASLVWQILLIIVVAMTSSLTSADEVRKLPRIGLVLGSNASTAKPYDEALREGLRDLGYVDGRSLTIVTRYANGDSAQFPAILKELIELHPDALVVTPTAVRAALEATRTIPIISPTMGDPLKAGLVASLAHPGGNLTGLSSQGPETDSQRVGLARELVPGLRRAGLLFNADDPDDVRSSKEIVALAHGVGVAVRPFGVRSLSQIQAAIKAMTKNPPQLLIVWSSPLILLHRDIIFSFAVRRMPVVTEGRDLAEAGALLTYSANFLEMWKRSAGYVDKILKGAKPGDLPIEQPIKFDLIVNLQTAKALGVSVPESILMRADEIIR